MFRSLKVKSRLLGRPTVLLKFVKLRRLGKLAKFASKAKINAVFDNFLCKNGVASKDFAM